MSGDEFTAYITRYALSDGILEKRVRLCFDDGKMVQVVSSTHAEYYFGEGKEWHRTRAGAVARAEVMRANKLRSIQKQKDRLASLVFE